jgi:hypothetical protein
LSLWRTSKERQAPPTICCLTAEIVLCGGSMWGIVPASAFSWRGSRRHARPTPRASACRRDRYVADEKDPVHRPRQYARSQVAPSALVNGQSRTCVDFVSGGRRCFRRDQRCENRNRNSRAPYRLLGGCPPAPTHLRRADRSRSSRRLARSSRAYHQASPCGWRSFGNIGRYRGCSSATIAAKYATAPRSDTSNRPQSAADRPDSRR